MTRKAPQNGKGVKSPDTFVSAAAGTIPKILENAIDEYRRAPAQDGEGPLCDELRALREQLGLSQRAFSERYDIPVDNVRNWEQAGRRTRPDAAAWLLIKMIKADPERVAEIVRLVRATRSQPEGAGWRFHR